MGIVQSVINSVETVCNAVGSVCNAVVRVVDEIIIPAAIHFGSFFTSAASRCANAVMSSYEVKWPPISYLLAQKDKLGLLNRMNAAIKSQNANVIEGIGEELKEMDMNYIKDAFVQAANSKLMCYRCNKKVQYIDDLCYCEISDTQCHHGTM
uniref:Uncharacterized protein n=1 Tax=Globodera rostochiensis TaxID=31243 RepID=A0A914HQK9_GLORO